MSCQVSVSSRSRPISAPNTALASSISNHKSGGREDAKVSSDALCGRLCPSHELLDDTPCDTEEGYCSNNFGMGGASVRRPAGCPQSGNPPLRMTTFRSDETAEPGEEKRDQ